MHQSIWSFNISPPPPPKFFENWMKKVSNNHYIQKKVVFGLLFNMLIVNRENNLGITCTQEKNNSNQSVNKCKFIHLY